jgi:hypothetical protein
MKKLNLKFFGLGTKIVLPLFLLFGLFLMSATTVSAQYVPEDVAMGVLKVHVDQLGNPALVLQADQGMLTPAQAERTSDYYRQVYGQLLMHFIGSQQMTVAKAITKATEQAEQKGYPDESIDIIRDEYIELLQQ